jgi:hypothetical protein
MTYAIPCRYRLCIAYRHRHRHRHHHHLASLRHHFCHLSCIIQQQEQQQRQQRTAQSQATDVLSLPPTRNTQPTKHKNHKANHKKQTNTNHHTKSPCPPPARRLPHAHAAPSL